MATPESEETPDESGQIGVVSETGRHADVVSQNGATQVAVGRIYYERDRVTPLGEDEDSADEWSEEDEEDDDEEDDDESLNCT